MPSFDEKRPLLLPHFKIQRGHLVFISAENWKQKFDERTLDLLNHCNGQYTKAWLARKFGGSYLRMVLGVFQKNGIIVLLPKRPAKKKRGRLIVLSPHSDDAALSIGGFLAKVAVRYEISILTIHGESRFSILEALRGRKAKLTMIRSQEDEIYAHYVNGTSLYYLLPDHSLSEDPASFDSEPESNHVQKVSNLTHPILSKDQAATVLCPLGIGHVDHLAVTYSFLEFLLNHRDLKPISVLFYEDLPYVAQRPESVAKRVQKFADFGFELLAKEISLGKSMTKKEMGLSIYKSQIPPQWTNEVKAYAQSLGQMIKPGGAFIERLWKLKKIGSQMPVNLR